MLIVSAHHYFLFCKAQQLGEIILCEDRSCSQVFQRIGLNKVHKWPWVKVLSGPERLQLFTLKKKVLRNCVDVIHCKKGRINQCCLIRNRIGYFLFFGFFYGPTPASFFIYFRLFIQKISRIRTRIVGAEVDNADH